MVGLHRKTSQRFGKKLKHVETIFWAMLKHVHMAWWTPNLLRADSSCNQKYLFNTSREGLGIILCWFRSLTNCSISKSSRCPTKIEQFSVHFHDPMFFLVVNIPRFPDDYFTALILPAEHPVAECQEFEFARWDGWNMAIWFSMRSPSR